MLNEEGRPTGLPSSFNPVGQTRDRPTALPRLRRRRERSKSSVTRLTRCIADWWQDELELVLTPTPAEPATLLGSFHAPVEKPDAPIMRSVLLASVTAVFNTTGQPAISLAVHWTADGLPVAAQLPRAT